MVADALSRLDIAEAPIPSLDLYTITQCMEVSKEDFSFHPLSYGHIDLAQKQDAKLMKILQMDNTLYYLKTFHRGGKKRELICYKD
mgnify:CR=1 FL=1